MMKRFITVLISLIIAGSLALTPALAEDQKLTLTFTGDVTLGSEARNADWPESFISTAEREGYDYFFKNWQDMFQNDDLTVVNLEGVLSDSAAQEDTSKTYRFRGPTDFAKILTGSGIDVCSVCNNHVYDFGTQGFNATRETLTNNGIGYFGYLDYYMFEKDGIKIAFFAVMLGWLTNNRPAFNEQLAKAREEGANAVVVALHGGQEYITKHVKAQGTFSRKAIDDMGADLVIQHHPHVPQGIAIMSNRYICYSLGNFCFGGNVQIREMDTIVVQADMYFDEEKNYQGTQLRLYPAHISSSEEGNDFCPVPVTGEEAEKVLDKVRYDTKNYIPIMYDEEQGCATLAFLPAEGDYK